MLEVIAGHDPMDSTSLPEPAPSLLDHVEDGVAGQRVGLVRELIEGADEDVVASVERAANALREAGATVVELSVPEFRLGLSAYYLIAPAEASSNLARYDGVRYGLRVDADDVDRDERGHPHRRLRRRGEAPRSCSAPTRSRPATTTRTTARRSRSAPR